MSGEERSSYIIDLDGLRLARTGSSYLSGMKPFMHQVESERLIKEEDMLFLFNHSPTGSGKTVSWLKPVLDSRMKAIAVYPTNALVMDQSMQIRRMIERYYDPEDYHVQAVTSDLLADERKLYPDESGLRKGQLLNRIIRKGRGRGLVLLTNPDILTLALKDAYYDNDLRESIRSVDILVVDEFHLASVKQSDMLLFMAHEICDDRRSSLRKFVFLSATPNQKIIQRAKQAGLKVDILKDMSTPLSCSSGHPVLPKIRLELRCGGIFRTYELIKEDIDYFVDFCQRPMDDGRRARTVFILDGIYEVDEIFSVLRDRLQDFVVERIDGLHPPTPEKLERFDVLVSNSSVEVGIDFDVDRLVFSGYTKSQMIQRIGRLRNKPESAVCEAICFVPHAFYDHLKGRRSLTREELVKEAGKVIDSSLDLSSYSKIYSPLEAFLYLSARIDGNTWRDYLGEEHHAKGMPDAIRGDEWIRTLRIMEMHFLDGEIDCETFEMLRSESEGLKEGLLSYRGSRFQALLFDVSDKQLKLYDLMYLLRRGDVEFLTPHRFVAKLRSLYGDEYEFGVREKYESMKRFAAGFCWYRGTIDGTRKVIFKGSGNAHYKDIMFSTPEHLRKPRLVSGFKAEVEPGIPSIAYLNNTLGEYRIFARLINQSTSYLKAKFNLGDFFYLYPYSGGRSVAFGHDALYIDCLLREEHAGR
ncbi:MAG: type I-D CRISPR-associated helicase Cas3' [Methanothrix sp.]|uniref:CRISPR-associated helicase, Cas3 family n=1 Tax=Methanothrix thermoacetophila (strain DSM 6194 / JCM 14653 / NBRC 101360 / PT) TaxID=349307 RepID=A0B9F3_METTP|nr:type I-D CRISPR-associated helicase Cas3' [Methanothrix thermoacetophila]ABK15327.1 CRISPR-associated helicase, Cas3 family [Methanothrix thermoacetophila PT]MBC7080253.1 type I-D CRISPR-associated helicase Cas3' [Methanothrix sp.]